MRIKVAVAVIFDDEQRLLITRRPWNKSYGGYWEFPGGKLEENEDPKTALARELQEEVGLLVITSQHLGDVLHDYTDSQVHLIVFAVHQFVGVPSCLESQLDLRWVKHDELVDYQFPEANLKIIKRLNPNIPRLR
ncbi:MAG: hypothetical protein A3F46_08575 [Legionellales bacterium RIFCSPHIGHO2_12_FULL_42_9]|nr:MAG: hypothetical protein A3F46_08575 [Legionellales bacterium RIFCSPHIGHO2_12_FULL_42_9]